jgi:hypothetical protein
LIIKENNNKIDRLLISNNTMIKGYEEHEEYKKNIIKQSDKYSDNNFSNNFFTKIEDILDYISDKNNLLNINENEFEEIDLNKVPKHITTINASDNLLRKVIFDDRLWEEINFENNNLITETFKDLNVKKLNLENSFCGEICSLKFINCKIENLILNNNCLNEIIFDEDTHVLNFIVKDNLLKELKSLPNGMESLLLENNQLIKICVKFKEGLKILNLENNQLKEITFNTPKSLEKLILANNKISEIKLVLPISLTYFNISNNRLKCIDKLIINCNLNFIDCSSNEIKKIDNDKFKEVKFVNIDKYYDSDSDSSIHIETFYGDNEDEDEDEDEDEYSNNFIKRLGSSLNDKKVEIQKSEELCKNYNNSTDTKRINTKKTEVKLRWIG